MTSIYYPNYPKAFIEVARCSREKDRIFVAMPFKANHSDTLWKIIRGIGDIRDLNVRRGDNPNSPTSILTDILEEIEKAEIIIADLTGLNPNVLYELGIAHVRCESVIILCQKGQKLPFDLASIRCIFYDVSTRSGQIDLANQLGSMLDSLNKVGPPTIIESVLERTQVIIDDLNALARLSDEELKNETIWFSGGLSALAIGEDEFFPPDETQHKELLLQERDCLLNLARRGCRIKCIITAINITGIKEAYSYRIKYLINFLE